MSRIGKKPIDIPKGVEITQAEGNIRVKGPKGELACDIRPEIKVDISEDQVVVAPVKDSLKARQLWGLSRTLIANMVQGVTEGYSKKLVIEGVGYRAAVEGSSLVLSVGFSHPVVINAPEGVTFTVEKNVVTVEGIDKQLVGKMAADIRKVKKAEPYKGKGIKYEGEIIRRKEGKKAAT